MKSVVLFLMATAASATSANAETTLRVMSYNIWGGGANEGKPVDETLAVLRAADADIIGLQETRIEGETCEADYCPPEGASVGPELAEALGYYYYEQTDENVALWSNGVLSRFPIVGHSKHDLGVRLDVGGRNVWIFNIHLDDEPYQPYQLLGIEYGPAPFISTAEEAVTYATETRGPALDLLDKTMAEVAAEAAAVFVTGDFNEPSGHDWTPAAIAAGLHPVVVNWPSTERLEKMGFIDGYRAVHPDPVERPAFTWTPTYDETATDDHPDRIDFVMIHAPDLVVTDAWIVGEDGPRSDIAVSPWPSDHRAVMIEAQF